MIIIKTLAKHKSLYYLLYNIQLLPTCDYERNKNMPQKYLGQVNTDVCRVKNAEDQRYNQTFALCMKPSLGRQMYTIFPYIFNIQRLNLMIFFY